MILFAPAKVNFGLSVLSVRPDGYHELHSVMVPLSVGDELEIAPAGHLSLVVQGAQLPEGNGNLVYRAARAYLDAAGVWEGARIVLKKLLPVASGLGGGSSDAASTLLGLARLYPSEVSRTPGGLARLALSLGADVPFFLREGAAIAQGVGERLSPIRFQPVHLVLANPGVAVSAADAYRWLDETHGFTPALDLPAVLAALHEEREVPWLNALQPAVIARHPEIARALAALSEVGLHSPLMSGSGATCFALASSPEQAADAARRLSEANPAWWVRPARTLSE
ncbi:4-(cytidine 5'-diphospho)-2-C-methyl-D-erythritol kinase [Deinococcus peraridilitoris]|uniref:4-diphosphocytidyl-2-C-methyl-D-erythritol kinase n=1 Tax=Deinococcus peraridilitoris (strain DSM 19664 / LMG 22246 / CIP 109416 / KR-200) TaxID=937777 RepID=L0A3E0_DEIPD|nr:4-(cytidine 5'-diphospho)-2-C-methyl-D-erythritol kinase [Deinococcus peraridilitoris]AFZ68413.1 4-diphosphocytidyl-2C-methyl-D-erythritol kinase [Deinococcus peraridilitoris DSM 19664]